MRLCDTGTCDLWSGRREYNWLENVSKWSKTFENKIGPVKEAQKWEKNQNKKKLEND